MKEKIVLFNNTFNYKVIYVFKIHDENHRNILKIGESTLITKKKENELQDNCEELNQSAKKRIRHYTNTLGVQEDLLYTTLAINNKTQTFKDKDVHKVLKNSGIKKHDFKNEKNPEEWYETNLETAINAINAVKVGRKALDRTEVNEEYEDIEFRPEQLKAIETTLKRFEVTNRMLWNAKMRFGKTLSTLEVIKRMSRSEKFNLNRAIILTHRPVVDEGWFEDYKKIFYNDDSFLYGSRKRTNIKDLLKSKKNFIYFASIQDLRESNRIGGQFQKNDEVFDIDWDLVVIDEAHEGTQTSLGNTVINEITKSENNHLTRQLHLSGTPFNLIGEFESKDIYTWDYIMEQKAKKDWEINHPLEPNPYADLPKMNIMTYNIEKYLPGYMEIADKAFNFREFFRVWTGDIEKDGKELNNLSLIGKFVHEQDVKKFLDLISKQDKKSNYPFSKQEYIDNFRHTFWILPGVKEAAALKKLMLDHPIFSMFEIVNVAGNGDDNGYEALDAVDNAIGDTPQDTYTITLSCGKLTTGVTVKPWTAVLYLAGAYSTSASSYLQTIFRVQSPASFGGKQKTDCYVFDFAPDRTLKMVAQAGDLSIKAGSTGSKERMKEFLNYCPVIAISDSDMKPYDVDSMLQQLKQAYVERVADNGFDDIKIYNDNLLKLDEIELSKFDELRGIIGATKQKKKINEISINEQGFTEEQWTEIEKIKKTPKHELSEKQKQLLEEIKEKNKQKNDAISILRGISIRIPLLIYGANIKDNEDITVENFTNIIDDVSWKEFMPKGVTKEKFKNFSKYYDNEIFIGAGRRIRNIAKYADTLPPLERAITIADIFSTFRNPDKETVLTPWKTVNMHMGDTIGGYNFYNELYLTSIEEPRLINKGQVTQDILINTKSKVLELNSKTGLYPLYITISLFKQRCLNNETKKLTEEYTKELWKQTVEENIYVVCKTPMAKSITKRTLIGYQNYEPNIINLENINELLIDDYEKFESIVTNTKTWKKNGDEKMQFDAIIGNPPYHNSTGGGQAQGTPLYDKFVLGAMKLSPTYISMIMPARWYAGGFSCLNKFRNEFISKNQIPLIHDFPNTSECFSNVEIKGGVCYFLWNKNYTGECEFNTHENNQIISSSKRYLLEEGIDTIIRDNLAISILEKVRAKKENSFSKLIGPLWPFITVSNFKTFRHEKQNEDDVFAYVLKDTGWVSKKEILKNQKIVNSYKLFIPRSIGSGDVSKDIVKPIIAEPNSCCSGTYIVCGPFKSKEQCENVKSYINTKFFHFLLSLKKVSQDTTASCYEFIPIQKFNTKINDQYLYKKYQLSKEEIEYIEKRVRSEIGN